MDKVRIAVTADEYETPLKRLCNGFYYIVDEQGRKVPFRANWAQQSFLENIHALNIILKARQMGLSTVIDLLGLDQALWNMNFAVGIIAHTLEDVGHLFRTKIQEPWEALPADFRNRIGARRDAANMLQFGNKSSVRVGTSLRSSSNQFLHISEYGKICSRWPDKAREIRSGALNTLHLGNLGFIESTAEGAEGDFFTKCTKALNRQREDIEPGSMEWKFHFFAWWQHPDYKLGPEDTLRVSIDDTMRKYFARLEKDHDIVLSAGQQAWYAMKEEEQRGDMKREFPSYPEEAFEMAIEGAYFSREMARIRKNGQICHVPHDSRRPVHTAWDIGRNDANAIWFFQDAPGGMFRMIRYYEHNGESIQYYGKYMQQLANEHDGWYYGKHYLPHDGANVDYSREDGKSRWEILADMGFDVQEPVAAVKSNAESGEGIQASRDVLPLCYFDKENCSGRPRAGEHASHSGGIEAIDNFQREWNERLGTFRDTYLHNWASHGYKAFETFARGHVHQGDRPTGPRGRKPRKRNWKTA